MRRVFTRSLAAALLFLVSACSGGGDGGTTTPPVTPTIALQLGSSAGTAARGASSNSQVTVTRGGGYTGTVSLTAEGVPAGVSATLAPAQLSGSASSSTVTFDVASTAVPGSSTITIRAAGAGVSAATSSYVLTVPTPAVAITVGGAASSIIVGNSGTVPITIARSNGFADVVTLSVSGLPAGVTPTFTPATIAAGSTTSTLSLAVAGTAAAGTSTVTVSASGNGVTTQTATFSLTLTAAATPAATLTSTPAAVSIVAGTNAATTINVARSGGFAGDVALVLEGQIAGLSGSFSANPVLAANSSSTLTITATGALAPGIYNLTVRGTGTGIAAATAAITVTVTAAPAITIVATPTTLALTAGSGTTTAVTITRVGGYAGDVTLGTTNLPSGVSGVFAPSTLTGGTLTSTLTLSSTNAAALGAGTFTVTASGVGVSTQSATINLTVSAAPTYTMSATAVSTAQGTANTSTVTLVRGAGFAGTVNLAVSGLPAGVTPAFVPSAVTGTTSTLTLTVGGAVPAGNYTGLITGTSAGLADVTTNVSLTVTAAGGGAGNVNWTFCEAARFPLWFAFQNGSSGAWTRVTSTGTINRVYSFTVTTTGGVAYAIPRSGGGTDVTVMYLSQAEMTSTGANECVTNRATKSLTGSVTNVPFLQTGAVGIGTSSSSAVGPATALTFAGVDDGVTDLVGFRYAFAGSSLTPDRGVLRRNVNYAAGSAVPVVDFTGGESFAVGSAQYTFAGAGSDAVVVSNTFQTTNGVVSSFVLGPLLATGPGPRVVYGVPSANTQSGDLQLVTAVTLNGSGADSTIRTISQYNRNLTDRTLTLGAALTPPTISSLGTAPYARFSATGTWQAQYGDAAGATFYQSTGAQNSWTITTSRTYSGGGGSWTLSLPDFSAVSGFNAAWALAATTTNWSASASSISGAIGEGTSFQSASRTGTIAP